MTGQLRYLDVGMRLHNAKHVHATWWLEPEGRLIFRDPRRFGGLWTLRSVQDLEARWADLGPDALSVTAPVLKRQLGDSTRSIKSALLDQSILSGVGNIYADEALFLAGVHPARVAGDLSNKELGRLSHALREVLETSIASGGSTLKDYADGDGIPGRAQEKHLVYGRAGKNCTTCGTSLCKGVLAQRTTVWCPRCQPTKDLSV
jgi:formamidopyrimidine-DNA glycosylase